MAVHAVNGMGVFVFRRVVTREQWMQVNCTDGRCDMMPDSCACEQCHNYMTEMRQNTNMHLKQLTVDTILHALSFYEH